MSNPPPYPATTLTEKFTALAADVEAYIEEVNGKLDAIKAAQDISNTALAAILGALAALTPVMQQAADCSCAAAAALEDAPWNEPPPPPACDDLNANPELLTFDEYIGFGLNFWRDEANGGYADFTNVVPGFAVDDGGQTLILTGPAWYRFEFNKVGEGGSINYFGSGGGDQELQIVVTATEPTVRYFYVIGPQFGMYTYLNFSGIDPAEHDVLRLSSFSVGVCDGGTGGGPS